MEAMKEYIKNNWILQWLHLFGIDTLKRYKATYIHMPVEGPCNVQSQFGESSSMTLLCYGVTERKMKCRKM